MKDVFSCPICRMEIFSELGEGCKMCGMVLNNGEDFCCKICMRMFNTIRRKNE